MIFAGMEAGGLALAGMPRSRSTGPTGRRHLLLLLLLGAAALTLLLTLLLAFADDSGTPSGLAAARRENGVLRARQEALRAELFEVARRLQAVEVGRQTPGGDSLLF